MNFHFIRHVLLMFCENDTIGTLAQMEDWWFSWKTAWTV